MPRPDPPAVTAAGAAWPAGVGSGLVRTILITGAAGRIGSMLRARLAGPGRVLRLLDVTPLAQPPGPDEDSVTASVTDMAAMTAACAGADAVIHLGGIPTEDAWAPILDVNINGTYTVFEAARRAGVPRVVFASSNHAVGFTPRDVVPRAPTAPPRFPTPTTASPRRRARRSPPCTRTATALRRSASASCPASTGRATRGCWPRGCPRTTPAGSSRRA